MKLTIFEDTVSIPCKTSYNDTGFDNGIYYFGKKPKKPINWKDVKRRDVKTIKESFDTPTGDEYVEFDSKKVLDFDGFYTDYTMYIVIDSNMSEEWLDYVRYNTNRSVPNRFIKGFVFVLGDKDLYDPREDNVDFDYECESKGEALQWFDNYVGYED